MPRDSWNREVQRCFGHASCFRWLHIYIYIVCATWNIYIYIYIYIYIIPYISGVFPYIYYSISTSRETLVWFCDPTDQPEGAHRILFRSLRFGPRHAMLQLWSTAVLGHMNTTTCMSAVEQDRQMSNTTVESILCLIHRLNLVFPGS